MDATPSISSCWMLYSVMVDQRSDEAAGRGSGMTAVRISLTLIALLFLHPARANAPDGFPAAEFFSQLASADAQTKVGLLGFFGGLLDGISWTNVMARQNGRAIYCPPGALRIDLERGLTMAKTTLQSRPSWGTYPIGLVLLQAHRLEFPCR